MAALCEAEPTSQPSAGPAASLVWFDLGPYLAVLTARSCVLGGGGPYGVLGIEPRVCSRLMPYICTVSFEPHLSMLGAYSG